MKYKAKKNGKTRLVLGVDFGTLSGRALIVNADTGEEVAWVDHPYKNKVIEKNLPNSKKRLKPQTALQDIRKTL